MSTKFWIGAALTAVVIAAAASSGKKKKSALIKAGAPIDAKKGPIPQATASFRDPIPRVHIAPPPPPAPPPPQSAAHLPSLASFRRALSIPEPELGELPPYLDFPLEVMAPPLPEQLIAPQSLPPDTSQETRYIVGQPYLEKLINVWPAVGGLDKLLRKNGVYLIIQPGLPQALGVKHPFYETDDDLAALRSGRAFRVHQSMFRPAHNIDSLSPPEGDDRYRLLVTPLKEGGWHFWSWDEKAGKYRIIAPFAKQRSYLWSDLLDQKIGGAVSSECRKRLDTQQEHAWISTQLERWQECLAAQASDPSLECELEPVPYECINTEGDWEVRPLQDVPEGITDVDGAFPLGIARGDSLGVIYAVTVEQRDGSSYPTGSGPQPDGRAVIGSMFGFDG